MTKQEKIKKEWGSFYTDKVSPDGWLNIHPKNYSNDELFDRLKFNSERDSIRPKTLQGIEHNHGWIKIESENDLPITDGKTIQYFFVTKSGNITENGYCDLMKNKRMQYSLVYTHYQQIVRPEKPLY